MKVKIFSQTKSCLSVAGHLLRQRLDQLDLEKFNARLRPQPHAVQAGGQQDKIARFHFQLVLGVLDEQSAAQKAENLKRLAAQVKALATLDLTGIDAKQPVIDQVAYFEGRIWR